MLPAKAYFPKQEKITIMKKTLSFTALLFLLSITKSSAQCNFVSPTVELNFITTNTPGFCDINFNISFEIDQNGGNKYTYVHLWRTADYQAWISNPNYNAYSSQNIHPEYDNPGGDNLNILQNAVATIILNNSNTPITIENSYGPDPDAPVKNSITNPGITAVRQVAGLNYRYTISNVTVRVPTPGGVNGCNSSISFTGDAWSSQANSNNPPIHCTMLNWTYTINDVKVFGTKSCTTPLKYSLTATTTQTTPFNIYYNVYVDDGDGVLNTTSDFLVVNNNGPHSISSVSPYSVSNLSFDDPNSPYSAPAYKDRSLWYLVTAPTVFSNLVLFEANNACGLLPIVLKQFDAVRKGNLVNLQWETAQEQNNKGFAIERNMAGSWEQVGFVASQAQGGNSDVPLVYQYTDVNTSKAVTQYRLRQVDMDARIRYSDIKTVKGIATDGSLIVYPTPSYTGNITVEATNNTFIQNAQLCDISGRMIKQWNSITTSSLQINNLQTGTYVLKVMNSEGEKFTRKVFVLRK